MNAPVQVALLVETSNAYARGLLHGVVSYIREHRSWSLYLSEHNRGDRPPRWLARWKGDGIIARIENASIAEALRQVRLGIDESRSSDPSFASSRAASSGSPTNIPSTSGARRIDSRGVVEAWGPKQNIGAPKCF